jgi:hypothetical protein
MVTFKSNKIFPVVHFVSGNELQSGPDELSRATLTVAGFKTWDNGSTRYVHQDNDPVNLGIIQCPAK